MSGSYLMVRLQLEDELRHDASLTPLAFKVAIELVRRRHAETGQCNISIATLANKLSCGTRTIDRALVALAKAGWLVKTTGKGRSSNTYVIPRLERRLIQQRTPDASEKTVLRQNSANAGVLLRPFDRLVAPIRTPLSHQNGAQSLLGISLTDLTPIVPDADADADAELTAGGGGAPASPEEASADVQPPGIQPSEVDRLWASFVETYPDDMLDAMEPAREHFRGLSPGDQADAVRLLPGYLAEHARRKRNGRHVGRLRWLKERRWEGLLRAEAPRAVGARADGGRLAAIASDADPVLDFPGGFKRRESFVVAAIAKWRERPASWPEVELGAPPGVPGCRVPSRLLVHTSTCAREPAEGGT